MAGDCAGSRDDGFFSVGWLTRIAVSFAIIGVLALDGVSLATGHLRIDDAATQAATAASTAYGPKADEQAARTAAAKAAQDADTTLTDLTFVDGNVTATVHGTIHTIVVGHLPGTAGLVAPSAVVTLRIVTS